MAKIVETQLPGVGVRYDFVAGTGERLGVIHHRGGRREFFVCDAHDPDAVEVSVDLDDAEAFALAEIMGVSPVVESLTRLQQAVEGLAIDWLQVGELTPYDEGTIGDARIRTRTGVSVVAVIRGEEHFPAPGPDFRIDAGDTLVVVGTPEGIAAARDILATG